MVRDNGNPGISDDWFDLCGLDKMKHSVSFIGLFIDVSGSMDLSTVQNSRNLFLTKLSFKMMFYHHMTVFSICYTNNEV